MDAIFHYLVPFTLPRSEVKALDEKYGKIALDDFKLKHSQLLESAKSLFIRAHKITNRNGEAGELLLYLLTEWILGAPQLIAKMSLKTNREMPVYGADGIHVRYSKLDRKLLLYWGESKIHSSVGDALSRAAASIAEALEPDKLKHEIGLVQRNIDFSGLDKAEREALLKYLDPFEEAYNERHDITTALIGFDFNGFSAIAKLPPEKAEAEFIELANKELASLAPKLANTLKKAGLEGHPLELFFFPIPSVQIFRELFQEKIGWKQ